MKTYFGELNKLPNSNGGGNPLIAGHNYDTLLIRDRNVTPGVKIDNICLQEGDMVLFCSSELLVEGGLEVIADLFKEESYIYPLQHVQRVAADKSIEQYFAILMRICDDEPDDKTDSYLFKLRRRPRGSDEVFVDIEYFRTRREAQYRLVERSCFGHDSEMFEYGLSCFPDGNGPKWKPRTTKKTMTIAQQQELHKELLKPVKENRPYGGNF